MSYTCVICLNNKELDTLMINIRCGHACICQECQNNLPNIVFTEKSCPLCRRNGNYRNVILNIDNENENENQIEDENDLLPNNMDIDNEIYDKVIDLDIENDARVTKLKQILYEGISSNYFILTYEKGNYFNPQDDRLENMVMAFYGTESCLENNYKPYFIDVTKRVQLAINIRRRIFVVSNDNLLKQNTTLDTKNWLITILCVR